MFYFFKKIFASRSSVNQLIGTFDFPDWLFNPCNPGLRRFTRQLIAYSLGINICRDLYFNFLLRKRKFLNWIYFFQRADVKNEKFSTKTGRSVTV